MKAFSTTQFRQTGARLAGLCAIISGVGLALPAQPAAAETQTAQAKDRVRFSVQVVEQVETDRAVGQMSAQFEAAAAGDAAERVNSLVSWAMAEAGRVTAVEARTLGYRTTPIYRKQHIEGWRVRQAILLRSADAGTLSKLLSDLQSRLNLDAIRYEVSRAKRERVEAGLLGKAITAFKARAQRISEHMSRPGYELVSMQLQTQQSGPSPVPRLAVARSMKADQGAIAPPVIAGDTETITLYVNGTIELRPAAP